MPLCPQITNTPILVPAQVAITAVSFTPTTATYTASGHSFIPSDVVVITDLAPSGYNGTFSIIGTSGSTSFTVANTTNATVTDQSGLATPGGNFDTSSVVPVLAADTVQVTAVANTANAASQTATQAFNAAVAAGAAASTAQATANGKNKVVYSTSAPGSTANTAGDIWFQYGTVSPNINRVIAQFIGAGGSSWTQTTISGLVVANIDAASITTGTLSVGLGITTAGGTFTVNAVTGALFANSATITGAITATSGSFTGSIFASSGTIGGSTLASSTITGGTIQTASSGSAVILDGSNNALKFTNSSGTAVGWILPYSADGMVFNYGSSPSSAFSVFPAVALGSTSIILQANSTHAFSVSTSGVNASSLSTTGTLTANGELFAAGHSTTTNAANAFIFTTGGRIARSTASSARYKENIVNLSKVPNLDAKKLLELPVRAFTYKEGYLPSTDKRYEQMIPGFIAEEVASIYGIACDYVNENQPESWNDRMIVPAMLALIQDLYKEIDILKGA